MITHDTILAVSNIKESYIRNYCIKFIIKVDETIGKFFEVTIKELILEEEDNVDSYVILHLDLKVKEGCALVYTNSRSEFISSTTSLGFDSYLFITPNPAHYNGKHDLRETIRRELSRGIQTLDRSTYLCGTNVVCTTNIDVVDFRNNLIVVDT